MSERLASGVGRTYPHSVTFEVSEFFLDDARLGEWSEPVQFRFERRGVTYDLVMRTVDEPHDPPKPEKRG